MIKVCDAIMGSGKSEAAITYMNEHPETKFVYITPYLTEAERIVAACDNLEIFEPCGDKTYQRSKVCHTEQLIRQEKSIATTHNAFRRYSPEMAELIREKKYTLIIDEDVNLLEVLDFHYNDIQAAIDAGYLTKQESGDYSLVDENYKGNLFRELFSVIRRKNISKHHSLKNREVFFCWLVPVDIINAFQDVFVLTYLFEGQDLYNMFRINEISYSNIYISRQGVQSGTFRFTDDISDRYVPEYVGRIREVVRVEMDRKLNAVGVGRTALSEGWFGKNPDKVDQLRKNLVNIFHNRYKVKSGERIWSTYVKKKDKLTGDGYKKSFVAFNVKATNKYRQCRAAAYCVNLFMNVSQKLYYVDHGIEVDEDAYALSAMVQWIWRTAIRDGKEIQLYVPSERMRLLLLKWMDDISKEVNE